MSGSGNGVQGKSNVIPFRRMRGAQQLGSKEPRARVYVVEDDTGELEFGMDEVSALNALRFLQPMLYLSGVLLKVYRG